MSNIDIELQDGNPAAIAVRFHVAQHASLTHMDFNLGTARAAIEDVGNQASDIHVHGGDYGIVTKRTAPVWQFLLMDSTFDGQRKAAIRTQEAGFTLVRVGFAHVPVALEIPPGQVEQLYGRDLRMDDITDAALVLGDSRNPHSEITLANVACTDVARFAAGGEPRPGATSPRPPRIHVVREYWHGLGVGADGREQGIRESLRDEPTSDAPAPVPSDIPPLPPMSEWVNVYTLGVKGDGTTDDTAALQAAIARHRVLYLPTGLYRLSAGLALRPDTVLIGFNPGTTVLVLADDSAAFGGSGSPVGVLTTPPGGANLVCSIGIATGVKNPRAAGVVWQAGPNSLLDDVSFPIRVPSPGLRRPPRRPVSPRSAASQPASEPSNHHADHSGTQAADLLVTKGGGGIFRGNWAHNTNSGVGLRVEHTATPGTIYQISVEHHMRVESEFHDVSHWRVYDYQSEEENPAGARAYSMDIAHAHDLRFSNTYLYRVSRNVLPKTDAVRVRDSDDVRFDNMKVFSQTRLAFDNAVRNEATGAGVRSHFFTRFAIDASRASSAAQPGEVSAGARTVPVLATGAIAKLADGFSNASGLAVTDDGAVFFTDAARRRVYRWNRDARKAELWAELPGQPMVLGFAPPSHLLAVVNERAVYALDVRRPGIATPVAPMATARPGTRILLPVGLHNEVSVLHDLVAGRGYVYRRGSNTAVVSVIEHEPRSFYYAPGAKTAMLAGGTWRPLLQSSNLAAFAPGDSHVITSEDDGRTYIATYAGAGELTTRVLVERGGTSVVTDPDGNVYIAGGQIRVYDSHGDPLGVLEVPERPGSVAFADPDRRTLYIGARSSLYSVRVPAVKR